MDEPAFLRAIEERPDDDDLLLVFADWLEERGDGRADFLRLLGALAQGTAFGNHPMPTNRHIQGVQANLRRLWKTADRAWAEQVIKLRSAAPLRFRICDVHYTGGRLDPMDTLVYGVLETGTVQVGDKVELPTPDGKVVRAALDLIAGYNGKLGFSTQRQAAGQLPIILHLRFPSERDWIRVEVPGLIRRPQG
jgi:uncharacterized protein (TIGR02996 family)